MIVDTIRYIARHPLRRQSPISGLGAFLGWQVMSRLRSETDFAWIDGAKLRVRRGMTAATGNIYCGLYEFVEMAFLLHLLRPGDLFIDVGANIGTYTVLASKVCGARTLAFEPDPDAVAALRTNISLNKIERLVEVLECAVGQRDETARFSVGLGTMNRLTDEGDIPFRVVNTNRLDSIPDAVAPTLLKLDVEGFEVGVLRGAEHVLASPSLLAVQSELASSEVEQMLSAHGFKLRYYDPFTRRLHTDSAGFDIWNALFVRDSQIVQDRLSGAPRRAIVGSSV